MNNKEPTQPKFVRHYYARQNGTVLAAWRNPTAAHGTTLAWRPKHIAGPPPTVSEEIDAILDMWQTQADEDQWPTQLTWRLPSGRVLQIRCEPGQPDKSTATASRP
jgi:hypothetical protein